MAQLTKIITRLKSGHFDDMKINTDNTRICVKCRNYPGEELSPSHIFSCPCYSPEHRSYIGVTY